MKKIFLICFTLVCSFHISFSQIDNANNHQTLDGLEINNSQILNKRFEKSLNNYSKLHKKTNAFPHIVGIDFGVNNNLSPLNWASISSSGIYSSFSTETGGLTNIELSITPLHGSGVQHYNAKVNVPTIPIHSNTLSEIVGNLFHFGQGNEIEFLIRGLEPNVVYNVWLFGVRDGGAGMHQYVTIRSGGTDITFSQIAASRDLFVNGEIGSAVNDLNDYTISVPASDNGEISFTVTSGNSLYVVAGLAIDINTPTVNTESVVSTSSTSALVYGDILDLGDPYLIQHGICWNTSGNPDLNDNITEEGNLETIGEFTSSMNNLSEDTTYYIRTYASNQMGTEFGEELIYTHVLPAIPISNWALYLGSFLIIMVTIFRLKKLF